MSTTRDRFFIYREVSKGGRVVKKYLHRSWLSGSNRWSWRISRVGAARFYSVGEAERIARLWSAAKIEQRPPLAPAPVIGAHDGP